MLTSSVIKRPVLTEKGNKLRETGGQVEAPAEGEQIAQKVVFEVARQANKYEIRSAVEKLFSVKVIDVRTQMVRGKLKRIGRFEGRRSPWKKAIVTLEPGQTIEFFEGV
jgi:large subunit ribosomal protein L23